LAISCRRREAETGMSAVQTAPRGGVFSVTVYKTDGTARRAAIAHYRPRTSAKISRG